MQDRYSHLLAADSEAEMEEWVSTLKQALQSATEDKRNGHDDCTLGTHTHTHTHTERQH